MRGYSVSKLYIYPLPCILVMDLLVLLLFYSCESGQFVTCISGYSHSLVYLSLKRIGSLQAHRPFVICSTCIRVHLQFFFITFPAHDRARLRPGGRSGGAVEQRERGGRVAVE